jgi:carbon storage regulator CsrA
MTPPFHLIQLWVWELYFMLVITRKPNDRILFPKLGITVHVVRVDGRSVRLGVEAPKNVHILRHEVANDGRYDAGNTEVELPPPSHELRNRMHTAMLALAVLQRELEAGQITANQIDAQIADVISTLGALEAGVELPARAPRLQPAALPGPHRKVALVVEDNDNERMLLVDYLQSCDYDVAIAHDGQDALDYLRTHVKPDVVLLDMNMPRLDGTATVREIRSNPELRGLKVIAVSGLSPRQTPIDLGPEGVDRWFTKPIRPSILVRELERELAVAGQG